MNFHWHDELCTFHCGDFLELHPTQLIHQQGFFALGRQLLACNAVFLRQLLVVVGGRGWSGGSVVPKQGAAGLSGASPKHPPIQGSHQPITNCFVSLTGSPKPVAGRS